MLTSRKLKGDPEATANYHMGEENYYFSQGGSAESLDSDGTPATHDHVRIHGALAFDLGFRDGQAITRQEFSNVLAGKNAAGVKVTRRHTVHGIDLTFSAPKSVSVAALLTHRDPNILKAHEAAVLETMREIERACAAAQPRPGECAPTANLAYVTALDGFNRDHEPHLHTHAVIANMTWLNGRVLALDGREIMARGFNRTWGTMYKTKLAAKLKDLGYGITYMKKGEFRLDAVSLEVEKAFSGRRAEILEAKERGLRDMQAWDSTRKKKDPSVVKGDVLAAWQKKLEQFRVKTPELNRTEAVAERQRWYEEASWSVEAKQELAGERQTGEIGRWQLAAQRATQSSAAVSEQEIIGEYLTELGRTETWNPITYVEAQVAFQAQVRAGHIVVTDRGQYTSWEMMRADRECVRPCDTAPRLALTKTAAEQAVQAYREEALAAGTKPLSERQAAVAVGLLSSDRGIDVVQGDAGSGKTTMLRVVNDVAAKSGWDVVGVAIQGIAARNLQDESGIKSMTLASYLGQESAANREGELRFPRVVVFDEASMLGSRDGARFLDQARRHGDRVVLVGDRNQIQSIGAGKPFERLVEASQASGHLLSLQDNWRQRNPVLREAVDLARQGQMKKSIELLERKGMVIEFPDADRRRKILADLYTKDTLIMAGTRDSCEKLNAQIRASLMKKGELEAKTEREYRLSSKDADGVRHQCHRKLAVGERLRFLQNDYRPDLDVRNGECGRVEKLADKSLEVRHDDGRLLKIELARYSAIDYGYAVTTYKGQGQTFDNVLVEADTSMPHLQDQRNSYVQITRARDEVRIFTDDSESLKEIAGIMSTKRDTLDLKPTMEEVSRREAQVGEAARKESYVWGREAQAFGRASADAMEDLVKKEEKPAPGPVRIDGSYLLEAAAGAPDIEEVLKADVKALEARINGRDDLSHDDKRRIAEFYSRPEMDEILLSASKPDALMIGAEVALGIRSKEDAFAGLSRPEIEGAKRCVRLIGEVGYDSANEPKPGPVRIWNTMYFELARGVKRTEMVLAANMKDIEDRLNQRDNLSQKDKLRLAGLFSKPAAAEYFFADNDHGRLVDCAEIALGIRKKEEVFKGLSPYETREIDHCIRLAGQAVAAREHTRGHAKGRERTFEGPDLSF